MRTQAMMKGKTSAPDASQRERERSVSITGVEWDCGFEPSLTPHGHNTVVHVVLAVGELEHPSQLALWTGQVLVLCRPRETGKTRQSE